MTGTKKGLDYDFKEWLHHFEAFEGRVRHFYLDGAGLVTIGVGCVVYEPTTLVMLRADDTIAMPVERMDEYRAVKAMPSGMASREYGKICKLHLAEQDIDWLFNDRLDKFISECETDIAGKPPEAQLAYVDMAFNLGVSGLRSKFPKFCNAYARSDWLTCSLECRRNGISAARNDWTRHTFEDLAGVKQYDA